MTWADCQADISQCDKCCARWPGEVRRPLQLGEIPAPPSNISVLFVGVAPTPDEGPYKGGHFYTSTRDLLRRGLFALLEEKYHYSLNSLDIQNGNKAFHGMGFFFVHTAKVRPITKSAPSTAVLRFCAQQHLRVEIGLLQPQAVCFLGKMNTSRVAQDLFGQAIGPQPQNAALNHWTGSVVVAPQPRRGWASDTLRILNELLPVQLPSSIRMSSVDRSSRDDFVFPIRPFVFFDSNDERHHCRPDCQSYRPTMADSARPCLGLFYFLYLGEHLCGVGYISVLAFGQCYLRSRTS